VFFREPSDTRVRSMPAGWTDVDGPDAFTVVSDGRAFFRVDDLLRLGALLGEIEDLRRK